MKKGRKGPRGMCQEWGQEGDDVSMTVRGQEKRESRVRGHENNISHNTRGLMNITRINNGSWKTEFMLSF